RGMGALGSSKMKVLLTVCFLLIAMPTIAGGQQSGKTIGTRQTEVGKSHAGARKASLTRAQIKEAERGLADMGYWTGPVDGVLDAGTRAALIALQKWEGRPVSGKLTIEELEAIRTSADSKEAWPRPRDRGYAHVEVDLDRQVLLIVSDDTDNSAAGVHRPGRETTKGTDIDPTQPRYGTDSLSVRVLPVSTGNDKEFIEKGQTSVAYTPRGRFVVYDKTFGWENGALGSVYYANYISGGVAIHGSLNVPAQPASHGCIRIPMFAAKEVSNLLKVGTIVLVYDKVSFVSAKEWIENPELKQAALLESMATSADYTDYTEPIKNKSKSLVLKKGRSKIIRT
ncbi:MAG TPA: L,D-transpeptidase family protein, partial [Pyrinomonadaceae bacterium]|nr:L,D-transpeptidase family protein [Pyrinomonadaceae bacterium]